MRTFAQKLKTSDLTDFGQIFLKILTVRKILKNGTAKHLDTINVADLVYRKSVFQIMKNSNFPKL